MAKYMLLIFGDPAQWEAMTPEQGKAHDAAHAAFAAAAGPRIAGSEELEPATMANLASMLPEVQASHSGVEIRPVIDHGVRWPAAHPDGG
jgi:hypothetical protein